MITHVLDTSAILAHYLGEPGASDVNAILALGPEAAGLSLISIVELHGRLSHLAVDADEAGRVLRLYTDIARGHAPAPAARGFADRRQRQAARRHSRSS